MKQRAESLDKCASDEGRNQNLFEFTSQSSVIKEHGGNAVQVILTVTASICVHVGDCNPVRGLVFSSKLSENRWKGPLTALRPIPRDSVQDDLVGVGYFALLSRLDQLLAMFQHKVATKGMPALSLAQILQKN